MGRRRLPTEQEEDEALARSLDLDQLPTAAASLTLADLAEGEAEEDEQFLPEDPPYGDGDGYGDEDPDISDLNNPEVDTFGEAPLLGARTQPTDIFGDRAETVGRATSPKLYASAAQFPTAVQYRVWRWENGIPVAIGAIDAEALEDDFIRQFYAAMPKRGDGRFQFRFRPVDIRGRELGKEFTKNISEHHNTLLQLHKQKEREREEQMGNGGHSDPILINQGDGSGGAYAEEMGRMFEQAVETAERRTELLQATLEEERERLREEEKSRYQERIQVADRSADVVQKMTEKLMLTDQARSKEQLEAQKGQSGLMMQTLTTVFAQQQTAAAAQADRIRQSDEVRMRQDREFFERQRTEVESKRKADREEYEARMAREREEGERKAARDREDAERKLAAEKAESQRRIEAERVRLELDSKRIEEQRKFESEALRLESERREKDAERRREADREETRRMDQVRQEEIRRRESDIEARRERERAEAKLTLERERLEVERREKLAREERERWRVELEEKRRSEREDWERKQTQMREDAERRERADRERVERERQDFHLRMEREKQEREDTAQRRLAQAKRDDDIRREEARLAEERRKSEMELKIKQMDLDASRAREHQEKMAEQARLDRESRAEAQTRRDALERESRESADRDRQRQHEFMMKQAEMERENAREHQERLAMAAGAGEGGGGGLFGTIGDQLGLEPTEILAKLFGKDGEEGGSWADAIPKVLGSIAELGSAAIKAKSDQAQQVQAKGRRKLQGQPQGQIVQTAQGPMMVMPAQARGVPLPQQRRPQATAMDLPDKPFLPPEFQGQEPDQSGSGGQPSEESASPPPPRPAQPVNTLARAKAAGLRLLHQKKARKGIRALGEKLEVTAQDEWVGLITEAITNEVNIYYYIRAVTVDAALEEATDNAELREQVVAAMKGSGLIPEDVPYNEEDYARLAAQKQEDPSV
jgi:hypothetical protein